MRIRVIQHYRRAIAAVFVCCEIAAAVVAAHLSQTSEFTTKTFRAVKFHISHAYASKLYAVVIA